MKVGTADLVWAAVSMVIVGVSFRKGRLIDGLLLIYGLMVILFVIHILIVRRRLSNSIAVYGTVIDYHVSKTGKDFSPILKYETESGREITSIYTVAARSQRYEIGSEEMICYSPDDPMFFYFSGREHELTRDYYRFIIYGGMIALLLFVVRQFN